MPCTCLIKDSTSLNIPVEHYSQSLNNDIKGMKVGVIKELMSEGLSEDVQKAIKHIEEKTKDNTRAIFNVCMAYGGRQEIVDATKKMIAEIKEGKLKEEDIDDDLMYKYMYNELPPIDFLIRTSGEERLSGFLLWQSSYSELYFTDSLWPELRKVDFLRALRSYQERERRFGV